MKRTSHILYAFMLAALALLTACHDDIEKTTMNFNARIEQIDNGDSKTQLVGEQWIYWAEWDAISINSNTGGESAPAEGILVNHNSENFPEYNGVFQSTLEWNSEYFCALYPYSSNNIITHVADASVRTFKDVKIDIPTKQRYASDTSFAHNVMPMVAWYGGTTQPDVPYTSPNLDFHSLGGIVRLQIYNASDGDQSITEITISSNGRDNKQLKGMFNVVDYTTFDPHLSSLSNAAEDRSISILPTGAGISFPVGELLTFYLVLPATKGIDDSTVYNLSMTINTSGGSSCTKNFTVPIRRNGITYMRALGIKNWWSGASEVGISGNGTKERPFKIYTLADLKYVRKAFAATNGNPSAVVKINKQEVTADTWFRIMGSQITLTAANWTDGAENDMGIQNFRGHMTFYGTNNDNPGITNNSTTPIFQSISEDGVVEGITVKCNFVGGSTNSYSPLCITNNGTIKDCRIAAAGSTGLEWGTAVPYSGVAGICVTNEEGATIQGCGCVSRITCGNHRVAGICLLNRGTIKECYASSPMTSTSTPAPVRMAGICDTAGNTSVIEDCYFAARINDATYPVSGIVSVNKGTVRHCYASESALVITSSSAAGIVGDNIIGGVVDYCWSDASLRARYVGMIATSVSGGKLINCFCNNALNMITLQANAGDHYAGGLVGTITDGSVENCYVHMSHINLMDNTGIAGGLVGVFEAGTVKNCYVYENYSPTHNFYGTRGGYASIQNCHLVLGTETIAGITNWTTAQFTNMQMGLNANIPSGGKSWEGAVNSTTPPTLEAYTQAKKKRK